MDQSTWVTLIGRTCPYRRDRLLRVAGGLLASGDHGGATGLPLGDAAVGALRQQLLERGWKTSSSSETSGRSSAAAGAASRRSGGRCGRGVRRLRAAGAGSASVAAGAGVGRAGAVRGTPARRSRGGERLRQRERRPGRRRARPRDRGGATTTGTACEMSTRGVGAPDPAGPGRRGRP